MKVLAVLLAGAALVISASPVESTIAKLPSVMYCGTSQEIAASIENHVVVLHGSSGTSGETIGEVWTSPEGWWFVQLVPEHDITCVFLGGPGKLEQKQGVPT